MNPFDEVQAVASVNAFDRRFDWRSSKDGSSSVFPQTQSASHATGYQYSGEIYSENPFVYSYVDQGIAQYSKSTDACYYSVPVPQHDVQNTIIYNSTLPASTEVTRSNSFTQNPFDIYVHSSAYQSAPHFNSVRENSVSQQNLNNDASHRSASLCPVIPEHRVVRSSQLQFSSAGGINPNFEGRNPSVANRVEQKVPAGAGWHSSSNMPVMQPRNTSEMQRFTNDEDSSTRRGIVADIGSKRRHRSSSPQKKHEMNHIKNTSSLSCLKVSENSHGYKNSLESEESYISPESSDGEVLEPQVNAGRHQRDQYDAYFKDSDQKLGMLLERKDEWRVGSERRRERAMVSLVVDMGPAAAQGVSVGSKVIAVNGRSMESATYDSVLEAIKYCSRPMRITFTRGSEKDDTNVGICLYKTCAGIPRSYKQWKQRFFVMGGAVARSNVLQLYVSKQAFDHVVITVFQGEALNQRIKLVKLGSQWTCSPIEVKHYEKDQILKHFHIKKHGWYFKQINFASRSMSELERLRNHIMRVCHLS